MARTCIVVLGTGNGERDHPAGSCSSVPGLASGCIIAWSAIDRNRPKMPDAHPPAGHTTRRESCGKPSSVAGAVSVPVRSCVRTE